MVIQHHPRLLSRDEFHHICVGAFRQLFYISGRLSDPPVRAATAAVANLFETKFGPEAPVLSYRFPGHRARLRKFTPALIQAGHQFLCLDDVHDGQFMRRLGHAIPEFGEPAVPYLGIEQHTGVVLLELATSTETADLWSFADEIRDVMMATPVLAGVQGFGFFLPPHLEERRNYLPATLNRYRAAVEITGQMVLDGIRIEGSKFRYDKHPDVRPGLPDIGWRTFVGQAFLQRLPNMERTLEPAADVDVEGTDAVKMIQAGSAPIWGDVAAGEDLSAFEAVAAALKPVRYPLPVMLESGFNGFGRAEAAALYLSRFDAS